MQFSDTTNKNGIIEQITFLTGSSLNQFTIEDRTREINEAYSIVASKIIEADGRMGWDDPNHGNQPIAVTDLIANQQDYNVFSTVPTVLQDWLAVERVDITDPGGIGLELAPFDQADIGVAVQEFQKEAAIPVAYDFNGSQVLLYPAPNYNYTGGMKMYFKRSPNYFTKTDTTKRPGFATVFHQFLPLYASYKWGLAKGIGRLISFKGELGLTDPGRETGLLKNIMDFYSRRDRYERTKITRSIVYPNGNYK